METLDHFSKVYGLIANMEKSSIFIVGVEDGIKDKLLERTGFTFGTFPIRYLGLPLSSRKWNKMDCQMLIRKITHRINVIYANQLLYAGRLQIVNVELFSIHSFWGNVFVLPQSVLDQCSKARVKPITRADSANCRNQTNAGTDQKKALEAIQKGSDSCS
ncbi:uncharacterized protein LOC142163460 [Nicotiana tabacum]|uniref:Uncharacterized protein LOC142163460 n=1 Tax=Nicotiana tabacum TaxID=4097 RepID=A0AC58RVU4_TOBAC